jgi:outer membrane protein, heavy metal efflux system
MMYGKSFLYLFVLTFALNGCVTFHAKPIQPEKTASAFETRTLTDSGLRAFIEKNRPLSAWPPEAWDLPLLTLAAFFYHPDLDIARAQWAVARGGLKTAGERPNPVFTFGPQDFASNASPGVSPWILGGSFDITWETAGKRGYRQRQAAALADAARLNIAQAAWLVRSRVRSSLITLWADRETQTILRHQQSELGENERLLTERSRSGSVSPLNATQATVLAGKNTLLLEDTKRLAITAQAQLADALGLPIKALESVAFSMAEFAVLPSTDDPRFTQVRRAALLGRADLLALLATYAASEAALQLEVAKQYPDLHIGPNYTYDQGVDKWGIGLTIPIPILNRNRGPIAEAEARREEAAARFLALQDTIINAIDRASAEYRASREKLEAADRLLATQGAQERQLRRLLRPGDVSRLTLFRSQLDFDSTRLLRADAALQAQQSLGALEDAVQQPLTGTLTVPNIEKAPREDGR